MIGTAKLPISCNGGSITPYGRSGPTRSSGTNTSVTVTSLLAVPRIPSVFQLSCTVTPGRPRDRDAEYAAACLGRRWEHADITDPARLAGEDLAPADADPPSTSRRWPRGRVKSAPPVETMTRSSWRCDATPPRHRPCRAGTATPERRRVLVHRHRERRRSAVVGELRVTSAVWRIVALRPPSSVGTANASMPASWRWPYESATHVPSASWRAALAPSTPPRSAAHVTSVASSGPGSGVDVEASSMIVVMATTVPEAWI